MYKFRLEKILSHRRSRETVAQQKLAASRQQEKELRLELAGARGYLADSAAEFETRKRLGLDSQELLLYQDHFRRITEALAELQARWEQGCRDVERRRKALVAASMDKRLLERLREKRALEFHRELLCHENNVFDEIAIQQFNKG